MKACQRQLHVRWGCRHNIVRIPKQCHGVYQTAPFRGLPHTTSSTGGFDFPFANNRVPGKRDATACPLRARSALSARMSNTYFVNFEDTASKKTS